MFGRYNGIRNRRWFFVLLQVVLIMESWLWGLAKNTQTKRIPKHRRSILTWNPFVRYFWASTLQNKALSKNNKGHLGSRKIETSFFLFYSKHLHALDIHFEPWRDGVCWISMLWKGKVYVGIIPNGERRRGSWFCFAHFSGPNYSDLSQGHPKGWFSKGIPPQIPLIHLDSGLGLIVICCDLPRSLSELHPKDTKAYSNGNLKHFEWTPLFLLKSSQLLTATSKAGWWFQICFWIFTPNFGVSWSNLTCAYFSNGLVKNHHLPWAPKTMKIRWFWPPKIQLIYHKQPLKNCRFGGGPMVEGHHQDNLNLHLPLASWEGGQPNVTFFSIHFPPVDRLKLALAGGEQVVKAALKIHPEAPTVRQVGQAGWKQGGKGREKAGEAWCIYMGVSWCFQK